MKLVETIQNKFFFSVILQIGLLVLTSMAALAQPQKPATGQPMDTARTPEETADLENWIAIVKNRNVNMKQRVFNAKKLLLKEWPEAHQAIIQLLDDSDGSLNCIPVCRAISQNGSHKNDYLEPLFRLLRDALSDVRTEAARVLAGYEVPVVAERLVTVIGQHDTPLIARSAALEALSQLKDSKQAARLLISLLDGLDGQIDGAAYAALTRVSGQALAADPDLWRRWWADNKNLRKEDWLQKRVDILDQQLEASQAHNTKMEQRLAGAYEQAYKIAGNGEKKNLLRGYLEDELEAVRLLALDLVREDIGEGSRPDEETLAVLRYHLKDESALVRKSVLNVIGHLGASAETPLVIELLNSDTDEQVRLSALAALGNLSNPAPDPLATSSLLEELQRDDASLPIRIAAARSIGRLNAKGITQEVQSSKVPEALLVQYEKSAQEPEFRTALLYAMSLIADESFANTLLENLQHDQADVRLRCITGLRQIDEKSHLDSMLPFLSDQDIAVRKEVVLAVGQLGCEESHLSTLLNRLSPDVEPEASVRDLVWQSFVKVWSQMESIAQLGWSRRLVDQPDRQIELLRNLEDRLTQKSPPPVEILEIRTTLAKQCQALSRFGESAKYWSMVEQQLRQADDPARTAAALNLFGMRLRANQYDKAAGYAGQLLAENLDRFEPGLKEEIVAALTAEASAGREENIQRILRLVNTNITEILDDEFVARLSPFKALPSPPATDDNPDAPTAHQPDDAVNGQDGA